MEIEYTVSTNSCRLKLSARKEVIREIPPEKMLDKYAAMAEFMGLLVDEKFDALKIVRLKGVVNHAD